MGQIEIAFRKPEYRGRNLVFPTEGSLYGNYGRPCRLEMRLGNPENRHIKAIEFDPKFDYHGFQDDIFSLIDPVERRLGEVELNEGVTGTASLGYSTMPVVRSRRFRSPEIIRTLYPISFKIELKYKDDVVGELKKEGVIAVAPTALEIVVVTQGVDHTGENLPQEIKKLVSQEAAKIFQRVAINMERPFARSLTANRDIFAYWDAHDIKLAQACPSV